MQVKYRMTTRSGDIYLLDDDGCVLYYSGNGLDKRNSDNHTACQTWKITGIREIKKFNNLGRLLSLADSCNCPNSEYQYNNGAAKYAVCDIDHGTNRIHGNFKYSGLCTLDTV